MTIGSREIPFVINTGITDERLVAEQILNELLENQVSECFVRIGAIAMLGIGSLYRVHFNPTQNEIIVEDVSHKNIQGQQKLLQLLESQAVAA